MSRRGLSVVFVLSSGFGLQQAIALAGVGISTGRRLVQIVFGCKLKRSTLISNSD
jgi:hypothetical protein